MAFMGVLSTNPDFSFIIMKNPATGMMVKNLRQGHLFGYYSKTIHSIDDGSGLSVNERPAIEYCIYFRDAENEVSYKEYPDQEFEYMNVTRYNSPLFVLDGIFNFLNSATKEETHEKDVTGHYHCVRISMMECHPKYLDIFRSSFKGFNMDFVPYETKGDQSYNYNVRISTEKHTLKELLNLVALFSMFHAIKCNHLHMQGDEQVEKYVKILQSMEVPYLIRYVFKIHLLRTPNVFKRFKEALEKSTKDTISLTFGNAYMQRQETIYKAMKDRKNSILDVGCGEGNFIPYLSKRLEEDKFYYGIDIDEEVLGDAMNLVKRKQIENTVLLPSLQAYIDSGATELVDVICTEVIEHMEIQEAEKLLKQILALPQVTSLIVTTPNSAFSKYYNEDSEEGTVSRHDDHKWEYNNEQFSAWVEAKIKPAAGLVKSFQYLHIGDTVNGECPTQGFILKKD